jgi:hypothetical protein
MIRVNAERLWSTLEMMAQIGGTPAGGVTRLALSEEDRIARNLLRDWALDAVSPATSTAWAICLSVARGKTRSLPRS